MPARLAHRAIITATLLVSPVGAVEPVSETARVNPSTTTLYWRAPEGCPTEADFQRRVEEYLGSTTGEPRAHTLADVTVVASSGGFHVTLRIVQAGQTRLRVLDTIACGETLDASALVVALAIDPSVVSRLPRPNPAPLASTMAQQPVAVTSSPQANCQCPQAVANHVVAPCPPSVVVAPAPTQTLEARPEPLRDTALDIELNQLSEVNLRRLPGLSLGLGLGATVDYEALRLSLAAVTSDGLARTAAAGGEFRLFEGRVQGCYLSGKPLSIGPCATASMGVLTAKGVGVDVPERVTKPWSAGSIGGLLRYAPSGAALVGLYANVERPFTRHYFELAGSPLYRQPAFGILAGLMLGLRLK